MHGATRLGLQSAMSREAVSRCSLLEERHLGWVEDEARATSGVSQRRPKTTPSRRAS